MWGCIEVDISPGVANKPSQHLVHHWEASNGSGPLQYQHSASLLHDRLVSLAGLPPVAEVLPPEARSPFRRTLADMLKGR
jgi:hypothetical protein